MSSNKVDELVCRCRDSFVDSDEYAKMLLLGVTKHKVKFDVTGMGIEGLTHIEEEFYAWKDAIHYNVTGFYGNMGAYNYLKENRPLTFVFNYYIDRITRDNVDNMLNVKSPLCFIDTVCDIGNYKVTFEKSIFSDNSVLNVRLSPVILNSVGYLLQKVATVNGFSMPECLELSILHYILGYNKDINTMGEEGITEIKVFVEGLQMLLDKIEELVISIPSEYETFKTSYSSRTEIVVIQKIIDLLGDSTYKDKIRVRGWENSWLLEYARNVGLKS